MKTLKLSTRIGARFFSTEKKIIKFPKRVFSLSYVNVGFTVYLRQHVYSQLKQLFGGNISKFLISQSVTDQGTNVHIFICLSLDVEEFDFDFNGYFTLEFKNGPILGRETSFSYILEKSLQDQNYLCNFDLPTQKL